ncbi:hypothetical protein [Paraglaciecola arctica]|uniref:Secreted protein n=1 Tax=Paraglaciecola arctica BSs20135 TaxID=493475 RepID=K6YNL6_9ALTE|nr:hypothetical protein [Paraglaciecola arctica]GAC18233.1 hypothetical protein GARC_1253 [Paraglaciecola arctica BSs20135]
MKITSLITLALVTGMLLLSYSPPSHSADTFWGCGNGWSFETKHNSSARCFKAAGKTYKSPKKCASVYIPILKKSVGHFLKTDHDGKADKCVGTFKLGPMTNSNVVPLACATGYGMEVKNGADRCVKPVPAESRAPSMRIGR